MNPLKELIDLATLVCRKYEEQPEIEYESSSWDDTDACLSLFNGSLSTEQLLALDLSSKTECLTLLPDDRQLFAFAVLILYEKKLGFELTNDGILAHANHVLKSSSDASTEIYRLASLYLLSESQTE